MDDMITSDGIDLKFTSAGNTSGYETTLFHKGLDEYKYLSASNEEALLGKIHNLEISWAAKWDREKQRRTFQSMEETAREQTAAAHAKIHAIESILENTLLVNDAINWESLRRNDEFSFPKEVIESQVIGYWINAPEQSGLRLKVKSSHNPHFCAERDALLKQLSERYGKDSIPADELTKLYGSLFAKYILLDWTGLVDNDKKILPYSEELAFKILADPKFNKIHYSLGYAAELASKKSTEYIKYNKNTGAPQKVILIDPAPEPKKEDYFTPLGLINKIFNERKTREQQQINYNNAVRDFKDKNELILAENADRIADFEKVKNIWSEENIKFKKEQDEYNAAIEELKKRYQNKEPEAILEYCSRVLDKSEYPENFLKKHDLQYTAINEMLLVDYRLPSIRQIPMVASVKYIKVRNELVEKNLGQTDIARLYDAAIYQIVLRTIHELFEADVIDAIKTITFNGLVTDLDPATGHNSEKCIVSLQTSKSGFLAINLEGIVATQSYKECFKSLKGVGSSKLSTMTSVRPILQMDKSDKRFRDHYNVADGLNDAINIAAMDWKDFENLVREIFEKEFLGNGGEVKITQQSIDGGVDAVAFDPDPIRGGKIVIQAKRYTNVVGVAAVRDLYGTVLNEGATKGILVTTSDYGADSYEFAKNKPLTLLNGANLLYLLERHGHKARIDIKEAKLILKNEEAYGLNEHA